MELRQQFEKIRDRNFEKQNQRAIEALAALQAALPSFELGLKLGKESSSEAESLIEEIKLYLRNREQAIGEQLYPARRGPLAKGEA